MTQEREPKQTRATNEPYQPSPLPPELADFLKDRPLAGMLESSDQGTVVVIKAPLEEIRSLVGRVPISIRHELYEHRAAPVIRTIVTIYDQPSTPLALEVFTNVGDPQQRTELAALATQKQVYLLFYDEFLRHCLSKRVALLGQQAIIDILERADRHFAAIPSDRFDFDLAKAEIMKTVKL
jgi:hypothetical protein